MNNVEIYDGNPSQLLFDVRHEFDLINLTDLWKAAGSPTYKSTTYWLRQDSTQNLISEARKTFKLDLESCLKIKRGRIGGGTWAHKVIALSYAGYLDKRIEVAVNRIFFERVEEEKNPDLIAQRYIKTYQKRGKTPEWINERFKGISIRNEFTSSLAAHGVKREGFRNCTNAIYQPLFGGSTNVIRQKKKITKKENIRDNLTSIELAAVGLSELLAKENIENNNVNGNGNCELACNHASRSIARAIVNGRKQISNKNTF